MSYGGNRVGGKQNSLTPILFSVLSHHRAYRSVHGGSLINISNKPIIIREENITGTSKTLVGNSTTQDKAIGSMPVTFSRVGPFPSLIIINTELNEITPASAVPLPKFPDHHT